MTLGTLLVHTNHSFSGTGSQLSPSSTALSSAIESLLGSSCTSLPNDWAHYISILALSRFARSSLLSDAKTEFLNAAQHQEYAMSWLEKGLEGAPVKLAALDELNTLLAHQPWRITPDLFESLHKRQGWDQQSELLHATLILCFFHCISAIVVKKDLSFENLAENIQMMMEREPVCLNDSEDFVRYASDPPPTPRGRHMSFNHRETDSQNDMLQYFRRIRSKNIASLCLEGEKENQSSCAGNSVFCEAKKFVSDNFETQYVDYKPRRIDRTKDHHRNQMGCLFGSARYEFANVERKIRPPYDTFQSFSWETEGYSLVSALLQSTDRPLPSECIDNLLTSARDSNNTFGKEFKSYIWAYVHVLYGIQFEDFDYSSMNKVLDLSMKVFIKTTACYPDRVTDTLVNQTLRNYSKTERLTINLMVAIARLNVSLLYALRAFSHQYSSSVLQDKKD